MKRLTLAEIRKRVEEIRQEAGDDERAHLSEDQLRRDVLSAIADGRCEKPREAAAIALETESIDFAR
jgi:hypothetical protein